MANYWWISFCDGDLPRGSQFLGAVVMSGDGSEDDLKDVIKRAWKLGINPGGQVAAWPYSTVEEPIYPMDTLLSQEDIEMIEGSPALRPFSKASGLM